MGRVQGKVALISGGARGMGASHARRLLAEGGQVVIGDLLDDEGAALAAELGENARYVHLNVTEEDDWTQAVTFAVETFGGLDVLVNNAGIASAAPIENFPIDVWTRTLEINLTGTFLGMRAAIPALSRRGGGSIINVSSVEGLLGIRVNSIHPGFIETAMTKSLDVNMVEIPLRRGAKPEEVSNLVLFLASDESSYSTGAEFVIDGGLTIGIPHN